MVNCLMHSAVQKAEKAIFLWLIFDLSFSLSKKKLRQGWQHGSVIGCWSHHTRASVRKNLVAHQGQYISEFASERITEVHILLITSDAMKFEPYKMCPGAFSTTFWQFFDFILQISYDKTFKIRCVRCLYIFI